VRCLAYRHGGGVRGNVGAGRINRVFRAAPAEALSLKADNPLAAEGGMDAETVAAASARIPALLRHNERAVAAADFADLALQTPGVQVGRAHVLPRHKPHERIGDVPGVVTLVVLPAYDPLHPDQPTPDKEMLRRVCMHLEPRRLVTTELYVTPPQYVRLSCSVAVEPEPGSGEETLRRHVELALRQYLAPLPPYGPDGQGWPFGRAVRDRDIEAAILRVQGVRLVNAVRVVGEAIAPSGNRSAVEQKVPLQPWQLPVLLELRVTIGKDSEPEALPPLDSEPGAQPVNAMPVPVGKEEC
jgi:predicted phage baseplate assembly protein